MKDKIGAARKMIISINSITLLTLLNSTYNFVRTITIDFKMIHYKGSMITDVVFENLLFRIYTDSEIYSRFCHPILIILIGIAINIIYYIVTIIIEGKKAHTG